jgi:hypothetical protein
LETTIGLFARHRNGDADEGEGHEEIALTPQLSESYINM